MIHKKSLIYALLLIALAAVAWLGWRGMRAVGQARLALADLNRIEVVAGDPKPTSLPALRDDLAALEIHLKATQAAAQPFLWLAPRLGWLPVVGPNLRAAPPLLGMAIELAVAGHQVVEALSPAMDTLYQRGDGEWLARVLPALESAAPELASAESRLAEAQAHRASIVGPLHPALARQLDRVDRILPLAHAGLRAAQVIPALLGADGPRTYLILAQNNHELRGTGGFISAAGIVRLNGGRIVDLKLTDSYAVDNFAQPHPLPPRALSEQMGSQLLLLRDSNWSPDFPMSAEVARALYAQDQGVTTDGAIALDLEATRLLVGALGSLDVPGVTGPVTEENVITQMKRAWEAPATSEDTVRDAVTADWWFKRKDFMSELMRAALAKLQGDATLDPTALARALLAMLDGRHLQIAVDDPTLAELLAERGWDGGLQPPVGSDFLAVVDSNVGFNKTNAVVRQEVAYRVEPAPEGIEATLTLTYTHTAASLPSNEPCDRTQGYGRSYDDMVRRCYWDYLRVYVPNGSELLAADGLNHTVTEPGEGSTTVFAGDFVQRPGEQHIVTLRYRPQPGQDTVPYRLAVRKQGGTLPSSLQVEVGSCYWKTSLDRDRAFECPTGVR